MDFDALCTRQEGVFSAWQLRRAGWSEGRARHAAEGLREIHHGVRVTGHNTLTEVQRCWAAVLTAPGTWLSHASLARLAGFDDWQSDVMTVTRRGSGGPIELPGLIVYRSAALHPSVLGAWHGVPCLSPARTLLDLMPARSERNAGRLVRNALRLRIVGEADLRAVIALHRRRRGISRLRHFTDLYAHLPLHRTKSDAEALGLAILDGAGVRIPSVNVKVRGEEADFVWWQERVIVELDGPQWHHPVEDARKQAIWERAGFTVIRVSTDVVYDRPDALLAALPPSLRR